MISVGKWEVVYFCQIYTTKNKLPESVIAYHILITKGHDEATTMGETPTADDGQRTGKVHTSYALHVTIKWVQPAISFHTYGQALNAGA